MVELEGIPAMLYTPLWHVREMGFLKKLLDEFKIDELGLAVFFHDYLPGGYIFIDGKAGDYHVEPLASLEDLGNRKVDCLVIGRLQPVIKIVEKGKPFLPSLAWLVLKGEIKIKGLGKLLKLARLISRCGISV